MASIRKRRGKFQVQIRRQDQGPISRTFLHRKDAEQWAREQEIEADRGHLKTNPRSLEKLTLGDLIRRYRDTVTPKKKTRHIETVVLNAFLRRSLSSRPLSGLRKSDFAHYRDERLAEVKPATLRRELDPLHNMFELAREEWGLPITPNPLADLRLPELNNRRERRLRDAEEERLLEAASRSRNLYVHPIIQLALETGMRRGEILGIRRQHIDTRNRTLLIPNTKNGHARTIPLTPAAYALLHSCSREREGGEGYLFPTTANAFRLAWERTRKRAGIEDLRFHDLRHEAISRFFEMGLTAPEVALISGHRDMRMLFRYTHPMQREIHRKLGVQGIRP
jgi:integrase